MSRRRADPRLHLELLRARGAAERIELSLAVKDISDRVEPVRRAADSIGSIAGALGSGGRPLRWLATAAGALMEMRWTRRALTRAGALLRSGAVPGMRSGTLGVLVLGAVALLIWRGRRRRHASDQDSQESPDDETG
jgi:hypothetical protein